MKKVMSVFIGLCLVQLFFCQRSEALYMTIENIGGGYLTAVTLSFDVEPFQAGWDFQVGNSRWMLDPSNIFFDFDEGNPLNPGEISTTPLIPQLTDVNFNLEAVTIGGYGLGYAGIGITQTGGVQPVIPDVSTYTLSATDIDFGATFSFYSGGTPVPEPATIFLLSSGLLGLAGLRRRLRK